MKMVHLLMKIKLEETSSLLKMDMLRRILSKVRHKCSLKIG